MKIEDRAQIGIIGLTTLLAVYAGLLAGSAYKDCKLGAEVREKADLNNDKVVSKSEWAKVYEFVGRPYNFREEEGLSYGEKRAIATEYNQRAKN